VASERLVVDHGWGQVLLAGLPKKYETRERWRDTVPADLIPAVKHLRTSFDDAHWGCGRTAEKYCYGVLHNEQIDDPAKEYFNYLMHMKARVRERNVCRPLSRSSTSFGRCRQTRG
jgi:hypothetical protein